MLDESPGPLGKGHGDATFASHFGHLLPVWLPFHGHVGPCRAVYRASNAVDVIANCEIRALTGDI